MQLPQCSCRIPQTGSVCQFTNKFPLPLHPSQSLVCFLALNSVQSLSPVRPFATSWTAACQAALFTTNVRSLLKLMTTESVIIQPSHPLSSPSPPTFNLSQQQSLLQSISSSHQVAKVLEFQLQHQSFQGIFRLDYL